MWHFDKYFYNVAADDKHITNYDGLSITNAFNWRMVYCT